MTTAAALVLAFLVSTAYGSAFHFFLGGPPRKIALYVLSAWVGFALGHLIGDVLDIEILKLGVLHLFTASLGSWMALTTGWILAGRQE